MYATKPTVAQFLKIISGCHPTPLQQVNVMLTVADKKKGPFIALYITVNLQAGNRELR